MIIRGNTVGTTMPRTNYNQTNPRMADYLKGKDALDQKIANAATIAGEAKTAANAALSTVNNDALMKSGGNMTGDINMNSHHITGLPEPTEDSDIITKGYMESYINNTFLGGEW